ncbi:XRE family transcriptional regulator [Neobacillus sp. MM2021_6]|uniref:XRE family transcriptional regulator n=1 Tax=Bacillaceae TaxID=186817 RepID=UPI001409E186|nr:MULTISPECIES: XRE family transcriptional regulator [Bacillaceae]MBO0962378.1 XRE family transcriptional regulator [Neobacillus sp. MM2021_6]NHC20858.1 XRE family transcriptional regulator [Bacillus sp. MM2020_4]
MPIGRAAVAAKMARKDAGITQLEMTFDEYYGSRESVSQQENGRYQVQPELSNYYAEKHNNPWVAMEAAAEYTNWGPVQLDGDAVDLHRTSVSLKTKEELEEALTAMMEASKRLTINPKALDPVEIQAIEKTISESIDAITALNHYVATLCKEYNISWAKMWTQHKLKLIQRRFIKK